MTVMCLMCLVVSACDRGITITMKKMMILTATHMAVVNDGDVSGSIRVGGREDHVGVFLGARDATG